MNSVFVMFIWFINLSKEKQNVGKSAKECKLLKSGKRFFSIWGDKNKNINFHFQRLKKIKIIKQQTFKQILNQVKLIDAKFQNIRLINKMLWGKAISVLHTTR